MNGMKKVVLALALGASAAACTRIETGSVGVRTDFSRQVERTELVAGSWNQTIIGDVTHFPIKDVQVTVNDMTPLASDNSTIADFDVSVVYSIAPDQVADIFIEKNRGFHAVTDDGDTLLMFNYIRQLTRNAAYKVARRYESLRMADNRAEIERLMREEIVASLEQENLASALNISQVLVRQIIPAENIVESANMLVQAQNEQRRKEVEVRTAELEAQRIAALSANQDAIEYMNAQAQLMIAEGVRDGKVSTIVVPSDFRGMVNVTSR